MKINDSKSTAGVIFQNTFFNLFSKFLTYLTFAVVAYIFGAQRSTDIYYLGTSFVTSCTGLFIIVISSVFSPMLIRIKIKNSLLEARVFAGSFFGFMIVLLLIVCFTLFLFPIQTFSVISKFPLASLQENKMMLSFFAFIILFTVISEFGRIYIESLGFFSIVAIITLIQSLVFILLIMFLAGWLKLFSLVFALLISLIIQCSLWYFFCKKKQALPILNFSYNALHSELIKTSVPLLSAHVVTLLVAYLLDYIASGLQSGVLTAVTFANRIYSLPLMLLFNPALEVINTRFSEYYHTNINVLTEKYMQMQRFFIMLLIPAMMVLFFFRLQIIDIFFLRGAFTRADAIVSANCLGVSAFSVVSFCILSIMARVYFIMQKTGWSSFIGTINQLLMIVSAYFLTKNIGYMGIPIAKVSCELFYFLPISFWLINKYLPGTSIKKIIVPFLGLTALGGIVGWTSYNFLKIANSYISIFVNNKAINMLTVFVSMLLCFIVYLYVLYKFKFREMELLVQRSKGLLLNYKKAVANDK